MSPEPSRDAPLDAEELFARHVLDHAEGGTLDMEPLLRAHPEHAPELRALHADWRAALDLVGELTPEETALDPPDRSPPSAIERLLAPLRAAGGADDALVVAEEIGRGAMGSVLRVHDVSLQRDLAMKVLRQQGVRGPGETPSGRDAHFLARFLEEARITGQLDHPGIVPVHRLGLDANGRVYFTMKLVKGRTLDEVFRMAREERGGWSTTRALGVLLKVCEAMAYAHAKGVLHRDLKPSNVMVGRFGEVLVMDWGLARVLGTEDTKDIRLQRERGTETIRLHSERHEALEDGSGSPLVTMDGDVVGTPAYMPPEQADGRIEELGPRADVYSLGAMLYHLLAGRIPFTRPGQRVSAYTVLARLLDGPPTPLAELAPKAAPELVSITEKAMSRAADARYADMQDLAEDLRAYLENRVVRAHQTGAWVELCKWVARNRRLAATSAAALVLLVGGALVASWLLAGKEADLLLAQAAATANEARAEDEARAHELLSYVTALGDAAGALDAHDTASARQDLERAPEGLRRWEWSYLAGRTDASRATLRGSPEQVWCVGVDGPGHRALSYGLDGRVRAWDLASGRVTGAFDVPLSRWPYEVALDRDLARVAAPVRSLDGRTWEVGVWDAHGGALLRRLPLAPSSSSPVPVEAAWGPLQDVAWNDVFLEGVDGTRGPLLDGEHATVVRFVGPADDLTWPDGLVLQRGYSGLRYALVGDGHTPREARQAARRDLPEALRLLFVPPGAAPALASARGTVLLSAEGAVQRVFPADATARDVARALLGAAPVPVALSPDGRRIAAGANDVLLFDVDTGEPLGALEATTLGFVQVAFDPTSERVAALDWNATIVVWDAARRERVGPPLDSPRSVGPTLALDAGGRRIASASNRSELFVWDAEQGLLETKLVGHTDWIMHAAFHPDGQRLLSSSRDSTVRVWDLASGRTLETRLGHEASATLALSADGGTLVTGSEDRTLRLWDVAPLAPDLPRQQQTGDFRILGPASGTRLLVRRMDDQLELWDLERDERMHLLTVPGEQYRWCAVRPDGARFAMTLDGGRIGLWSFDTGDLLGTFGGGAAVYDLAWDPAGETLAWVDVDGAVRVRETGGATRTLATLGTPLRCLAHDPAHGALWVGGDDGRARALDPATGETRLTLAPERGPTPSQALGPLFGLLPLADGTRLATVSASGGRDYSVDLWDLTQDPPRAVHVGTWAGWGRLGLVASRDRERFVVSKVRAARIPLFDARTGARLVNLRGDLGSNYGVVDFVGPEGDTLLAYSAYGRLVRFDAAAGAGLARTSALRDRAAELVDGLFDERPFREAVLEALSTDPDLERDLRQVALERCDEDPRSLRAVTGELTRRLCDPDRTAEGDAAALRLARRLRELLPDDAEVAQLLGAALVRGGEAGKALPLLAAGGDASQIPHPLAAVFAALAHEALGDRAAARVALGRAEDLLRNGWAGLPAPVHAALAEARAALEDE